MIHQKLLIGGDWTDTDQVQPVLNKYSGQTIGTVATASADHVGRAVGAAAEAAGVMAEMPAFERAALLRRTSALLLERKEAIARLIAAEAGKAVKYARGEVDRAVDTFALAAEEARRIHGETVPMDAVASGKGYLGFWQRRPVGVVAAITPFNFPLNLVAHKLAPAIAAGNSVVLKPATFTPLTAGVLCGILLEAGLPPGAINLVIGAGGVVGAAFMADPRVAKVSFTGSAAVGRDILSRAGVKKVTLELGNTSPVIVGPDADLDYVARRLAVGAFYNSGQVCISVQRVYADRGIFEDLSARMVGATEKLGVGDPLEETTDVGPMIQESEAQRIEQWVGQAKAGGATVLTGDRREGPVYWPTLLRGVTPQMKVVAQEAFAPVASLIEYDDFEQALRLADQTEFGLQAAVFTRDIDRVLHAIRRLNFGGLIINDTPNFRADHMPYGGNRQSGIGREGVRFAIEEMTNIQMVVIRAGP